MNIRELLPDVLLELAKQANVRDLLSFLSTCHVIHDLQFQRSLWLEVLTRIREIELQPLPLSTADPPDTLSLRELQNVARRADRLRRNLQSDNPRLFDMRSLSVVARAGPIFFIPGAHLAVTHSPGFVTCWDIVSSQMVGQLEIPHLLVRDEALSMDIAGKALVGACIAESGMVKHLVVICIDFQDRAHISVSHLISPATADTSSYPSGFFIDSHLVGFVEQSKIVFWCMKSDIAVQAAPQPVKSSFRAKCLPLGRNIYVLPWGSTSDGVVEVIPHPASDRRRITTDTAPTSVTCRSFTFEAAHTTFIHFRLGRAIRGDLELSQGCVYEHPQPVVRMAVGASGTYVLLLIGSRHQEKSLGLVHFEATPVPHTTFRKLGAGDAPLHSCVQVALDDALGLVLLVGLEGETTVLSYM
ncbi:hypothetical protein DFH08DRAFT_899882 [Mycena albidolilacea]|uniref:F-box domain-containing protein n=1 Tax=Mycena albidolilacea TaxID=1033008 RepID=A0AAD7EB98_9AGAR|nr:hypothetical protein DFH08DRAFT_899882 [Mycena albidolilacea]